MPTDNAAYTREEQMAAVAELANAAAELLNEHFLGSVQRVRTTNCGDPNCGYASCRLADAIHAYEKVADVEP